MYCLLFRLIEYQFHNRLQPVIYSHPNTRVFVLALIPVVSGFTSCLGSPSVWTYMYTSGVWVHLLCGLLLCGHTCIPVVSGFTSCAGCFCVDIYVYQWCLGSPSVWTYMYTSGVELVYQRRGGLKNCLWLCAPKTPNESFVKIMGLSPGSGFLSVADMSIP